MTDTHQEHPALQRFKAMKSGFDTKGILAFAVRDGYMPDAASAETALDGVMQWLASHAVEEHADHPFVMMNGPVDQMFHVLLLNTRVYLHLCRDFVGFFVHHTPLDDKEASDVITMGGIDYTIAKLQEGFGADLASALVDWVTAHERGELNATSVSCTGNGPDRSPSELLRIADFRTFWDTNPQTQVGRA